MRRLGDGECVCVCVCVCVCARARNQTARPPAGVARSLGSDSSVVGSGPRDPSSESLDGPGGSGRQPRPRPSARPTTNASGFGRTNQWTLQVRRSADARPGPGFGRTSRISIASGARRVKTEHRTTECSSAPARGTRRRTRAYAQRARARTREARLRRNCPAAWTGRGFRHPRLPCDLWLHRLIHHALNLAHEV